MSTISNNDIAHAIYLASKDKNKEEQSLIYKNTVKFLVKKKILNKASDILERLGKIINSYEKRIIAKVHSKEKLSDITNKELIQTLSHRYSANEVILIPSLNEKLLGGFRVEVNDEVVDLTIKNKLKKLQEYLISKK